MAKKVAKPKAPEEVFVEIDKNGYPVFVNQDPEQAEDEREVKNRLARYKFIGFVKVQMQATVTDVK